MKKIIVSVVCGFLFLSGNSLFAQSNFDDCFEIERLKAKSDGLGAVEAAEQASKVCKAKLGGTQNQGNITKTSTSQANTKKDGGFFVGVMPYFSGSLRVANEEKPRDTSINCVDCSKSSATENTDSGFGYRVGLQRNKHQIGLESYTWKVESLEVSNLLIGYDYVYSSGFLVGIGLGNGQVKNGESGVAFKFGFGYQGNITDIFRYSINYQYSSFSYDVGSRTTTLCQVSYPYSCRDVTLDEEVTIGISGFSVNLIATF